MCYPSSKTQLIFLISQEKKDQDNTKIEFLNYPFVVCKGCLI